MKKKLNKNLHRKINENMEVIHSKNLNEIKLDEKFPYPFEKKLLELLKKENKLEQEYYYLKKNKDYAFFVLYKNKMNIFTFGKWNLNLNLKVVGFPCSLSFPGYITNNKKMMLDYIKTFNGAKLVLNAFELTDVEDITVGETLPTCVLNIKYSNAEEYLDSFRSPYRRRVKKAIEKCSGIKVIKNSEKEIYNLYCNTYQKSNYKLEKLEKDFFNEVEATKIIFEKEGKAIGFVLLKQVKETLIFMLCGMDYKEETADLYYYMLYNIVDYAIKNKCTKIDFGQTSEETKMKFGAILEKRFFYAHHSNKLLNYLIKKAKSLLEYQYQFPNYHVFKEKK